MAASQVCTGCGCDADFEIAELWLCVDCYHVAGSTCAGIGRPPAGASGPTAGAPGPQVC
jgi:hypothetical protein